MNTRVRLLASISALALFAAACSLSVDETTPAKAPLAAAPAEITVRDINLDGREDTVYLYAPGAPGEPARAEADTDGNGAVDLWAELVPGSQAMRSIAYDTDGDGRADTWESFDAGALVERSRDTSGDGQADSWSTYQAGAVTETRQDTDGNGAVDQWSTFWPDGTLQRAAYDTDGEGRPDRWLNYAEDGALTSVETDTDADGIPDTITTPERR